VLGKIGTVSKQHVYVRQSFNYYEPGWLPIRELVAAGVTHNATESWELPTGRAKPLIIFNVIQIE